MPNQDAPGSYGAFVGRLREPFADELADRNRIGVYIVNNTNPDDPIWCSSAYNARYYVTTQRLSPTRYFYVLPHVFADTPKSSARQKQDSLLNDLQNARPKFIVLGTTDWLAKTPILPWIEANYEALPVRTRTSVLWELKENPASDGPHASTPPRRSSLGNKRHRGTVIFP